MLTIVPEGTPLTDAFLVADDILRQGVVGISEIIIKPGLVNVDFADVRTIMGNAGTALMGIGQGKGKNRAVDAALAAISSPLLGNITLLSFLSFFTFLLAFFFFLTAISLMSSLNINAYLPPYRLPH